MHSLSPQVPPRCVLKQTQIPERLPAAARTTASLVAAAEAAAKARAIVAANMIALAASEASSQANLRDYQLQIPERLPTSVPIVEARSCHNGYATAPIAEARSCRNGYATAPIAEARSCRREAARLPSPLPRRLNKTIPEPSPIPVPSRRWSSAINDLCSDEVELRGLSVRAHWHENYAWICVDVLEALWIANGSVYQLPDAHISLASVSLEPAPDSRHRKTVEEATKHCRRKIDEVISSLPRARRGRLSWQIGTGLHRSPCCFNLKNDDLGHSIAKAAAAFSSFKTHKNKPPLTLGDLSGRTLHLSVYNVVLVRRELATPSSPCSLAPTSSMEQMD